MPWISKYTPCLTLTACVTRSRSKRESSVAPSGLGMKVFGMKILGFEACRFFRITHSRFSDWVLDACLETSVVSKRRPQALRSSFSTSLDLQSPGTNALYPTDNHPIPKIADSEKCLRKLALDRLYCSRFSRSNHSQPSEAIRRSRAQRWQTTRSWCQNPIKKAALT